ncbi:MAG: type III pantothenate kinase, partial [Limisphaerales bacterium]
MILLLDIGNTNTHLGLANNHRVVRHALLPTAAWTHGSAEVPLAQFVRESRLNGAVLCSVVPRATPSAQRLIRRRFRLRGLELTA